MTTEKKLIIVAISKMLGGQKIKDNREDFSGSEKDKDE